MAPCIMYEFLVSNAQVKGYFELKEILKEKFFLQNFLKGALIVLASSYFIGHVWVFVLYYYTSHMAKNQTQ
jgi:hypothetical protein